MSTFKLNAWLQPLAKRSYCLINGSLRQLVPNVLQRCLQLIDICRLWTQTIVSGHHFSPNMVNSVFRSGEFGGHSSLSMKSGQFITRKSWVSFAVCGGAPSCWNMKTLPTSSKQSSSNAGSRLLMELICCYLSFFWLELTRWGTGTHCEAHSGLRMSALQILPIWTH